MEVVRIVFSIAWRLFRIVIESIFDRTKPEASVDKKKVDRECSLCGQDMTDPKVEGCSENPLFYDHEGAFKPVPNDLEVPCPECGCHPGKPHHAACPRERCPVCHKAIISCPCGRTEDEINMILEEAAQQDREKQMSHEPLGGKGSRARDTARRAFLKEAGIMIGRYYRTKPTDKFEKGRVFEVINISAVDRTIYARLWGNPSYEDKEDGKRKVIGSFWVKLSDWKKWEPGEVAHG